MSEKKDQQTEPDYDTKRFTCREEADSQLETERIASKRDAEAARISMLEEGWALLAAHGTPLAKPDFRNCRDETESRWISLGGRASDYRALTGDSAEAAEAQLTALKIELTGAPAARTAKPDSITPSDYMSLLARHDVQRQAELAGSPRLTAFLKARRDMESAEQAQKSAHLALDRMAETCKKANAVWLEASLALTEAESELPSELRSLRFTKTAGES